MSPQKRQKSPIFQLCARRVSSVFELIVRKILGAYEIVLAMWGTFRRSDWIILSGVIMRNVRPTIVSNKICTENLNKFSLFKFLLAQFWEDLLAIHMLYATRRDLSNEP